MERLWVAPPGPRLGRGAYGFVAKIRFVDCFCVKEDRIGMKSILLASFFQHFFSEHLAQKFQKHVGGPKKFSLQKKGHCKIC